MELDILKLVVKSKTKGHDMEYDVHIKGKMEEVKRAMEMLIDKGLAS